MKIKLVFVCLFFLIVACGNEPKKAEPINEDEETVDQTIEEFVDEGKKSSEKKSLTIDEKINIIKDNFKIIKSQISNYEKKEQNDDVGGGFIGREGYFDAGVPRKIKHGDYGEHGSKATTFYLHDNKLFFVLEEEFSEETMRGPFTKKETRFYIYENEVIRVLEKKRTVVSGVVDIENAKNKDVTEQWKSKSNVVSAFEKILRDTSVSLINVKSVSLDNGRWISKEDPSTGIELKNGKLIMFHKSAETTTSNTYSYELTEHEGVEYMTLIKDTGEELKYSILEYTDEIFVISYLARGNRLTYVKEK